jgi:hypothetical protein
MEIALIDPWGTGMPSMENSIIIGPHRILGDGRPAFYVRTSSFDCVACRPELANSRGQPETSEAVERLETGDALAQPQVRENEI